MLRPPQPAVYLFLLDVSRQALETGYLRNFCDTLAEELDKLPGDARTQVCCGIGHDVVENDKILLLDWIYHVPSDTAVLSNSGGLQSADPACGRRHRRRVPPVSVRFASQPEQLQGADLQHVDGLAGAVQRLTGDRQLSRSCSTGRV